MVAALACLACSNPSSVGVDALNPADGQAVETVAELIIVMDIQGPEWSPDLSLDLVRADHTSDVLELGCEPGAGCFLDPCSDNSDCQSGWCVQHLGESVCSQNCQEECPPGWTCQQVAGTVPDVVYICVSDYANLCRPCADNADCTSTGGAEDACLSYGSDGSFCGGPCTENGDCPWGFSCQETATVDGVMLSQCVAETGVCPCTDRSAKLGLTTPCNIENEFGLCLGKRACTDQGLSPCDALVPAAETCNGVDDDCDGEADEPGLEQGTYVELCDDGNDCTDDTCAGEEGCVNTLVDSGSCDDGNPCTVADHCEAGTCVGKPVNCDDENPCTDDSCSEDGGCLNAPNEAVCDDGDPCTVADRCGAGQCDGTSVSCECQNDADCGGLEDGNLCNGTLVCDTSKLPHLCVVDGSTAVTCPAPSGSDAPCLNSACAPETGECALVAANEGAPCDAGNACTGKDTCQAGICTPGPTINCNDGNPCTDDSCDPEIGCQWTPNTVPCDDGNICTTADACQAGDCVGTGGLACNDGNVCTDDMCTPDLGCVATANEAGCDDGNPCTTVDQCSDGACVGKGSLDCDDFNLCTTDSCDPEVGCVHLDNVHPCDDGNSCTTMDGCKDGVCIGGGALDCDDDNVCTEDSCAPDSGCVHVANQTQCDDGNECTPTDLCVAGKCVGQGTLACDDDDVCTTDACVPGQGCVYELNTAPCNDGSACTLKDTCSLGECLGTQPLVCNDGNPCTDDSCSPEAGCQFLPNNVVCDDGNACTANDVCQSGTCGGQKVVCDDDNPCTLDSCDFKSGCQVQPLPDGIQVAGCDGLCMACVDGQCGLAAEGTDPGDDCDAGEEFQTGGESQFCQQRIRPGSCDGAGGCSQFGVWSAINDGQQCASDSVCVGDVFYAATSCVDGLCAGGLGEVGCCGDSICPEKQHCALDTHTCVPDGPPCQGWEYNGFCWYYDNSSAYEFTCTELCQAHGAQCVLEGRLQEAVNPECTVCRHWFPGLTCSFAQHDEAAKPCTYTTSKCEYANYSPALSTCDGPKFGTNTRRFCSCTF